MSSRPKCPVLAWPTLDESESIAVILEAELDLRWFVGQGQPRDFFCSGMLEGICQSLLCNAQGVMFSDGGQLVARRSVAQRFPRGKRRKAAWAISVSAAGRSLLSRRCDRKSQTDRRASETLRIVILRASPNKRLNGVGRSVQLRLDGIQLNRDGGEFLLQRVVKLAGDAVTLSSTPARRIFS